MFFRVAVIRVARIVSGSICSEEESILLVADVLCVSNNCVENTIATGRDCTDELKI